MIKIKMRSNIFTRHSSPVEKFDCLMYISFRKHPFSTYCVPGTDVATIVPEVLGHIYYSGNMAGKEKGVVGSSHRNVGKKDGVWVES